jgi:hypothetical protein
MDLFDLRIHIEEVCLWETTRTNQWKFIYLLCDCFRRCWLFRLVLFYLGREHVRCHRRGLHFFWRWRSLSRYCLWKFFYPTWGCCRWVYWIVMVLHLVLILFFWFFFVFIFGLDHFGSSSELLSHLIFITYL